MKLHLKKELFTDAIKITAQAMNISPMYIEKDYWVTLALHTIFHNAIGDEVVFKGGTALSKCFKLIERFSEDIDLVVLRKDGETDNKLKNKLKTLSSLIDTVLQEVELEGITHKMGMNRKTAHQYSKLFVGNYGQVRDVVVLESSWLGNFEPYTTKDVISYVGSMLIERGQIDILKEYDLIPFQVKVLDPKRTLCEKIMSLVRFSYTENPLADLKNKIRHTYDIHQLLNQKEFSDFLNSAAFEKMLLKVAQDDVLSFKNNNQWLIYPPKEALFFRDLDAVWKELKTVYTGDFKSLVFGKLPESEAIYNSLKRVKEIIERVKWEINFNAV